MRELIAGSSNAHVECPDGLVLMHGKKTIAAGGKLYPKADSFKLRVAMQGLVEEAAAAQFA